MCGIFASTSKSVINELAKANAYRGQHSFSVTTLELSDRGVIEKINVHREIGVFNLSKVPEYGYKICHIQAPTGSNRTIDQVHPADISGSLLWHNGIIKEYDCNRLREKQWNNEPWDTKLLLTELRESTSNLSEINGSFACLYLANNRLYVFRNLLAPMFSDGFTLSSVKTEYCKTPVPAGKFLWVSFDDLIGYDEIEEFQTREVPWYGLEAA